MVTGVAALGDLVLNIDGSLPVSIVDIESVLQICDRAEDGFTTGLLTAYVSGAPSPGWTRTLNIQLLTKWERAVRRLERLNLFTVSVANGDCGGTALDVLLATDVRIAVRGARLAVSSDGGATWPGMSLYRLARQSGQGGLRPAALLGTPIEAPRAVAMGILDAVVEESGTVLPDLAAQASSVSGKELAIRRQLVLDADQSSFEDALGPHLATCDRALRHSSTP